jgi:hypothetical protein
VDGAQYPAVAPGLFIAKHFKLIVATVILPVASAGALDVRVLCRSMLVIVGAIAIGGTVQEFLPFIFFPGGNPFSPMLSKLIKTDRRATKRETIFDNAHQQINCTCRLLHANQSYYLIALMSIAINS